MTLEVGKTYKTRGFGLAQLVYMDPQGGLLMVPLEPTSPRKSYWLYGGGFYFADHGYSPFDLLPEKKSMTGFVLVLQHKSCLNLPPLLKTVKDEASLVRLQRHFTVLSKQAVELEWEV